MAALRQYNRRVAELPLTQTSILVKLVLPAPDFVGKFGTRKQKQPEIGPFSTFVTLWQQSGVKWLH
jgi:hypothetical protein